jgi:hypothetical protein
MYDRLTGSTTMVISSGGTTIPGSPARPEYLKASVYFPPAFISHHPDLHRPIIDIVQHYIETIGVRTVTMWSQRARRDLHYSLTQVGNPRQNALANAIPNPEYNSAHYTFLGQPYRITDDPSATPVQAPSPVGSTASFDFGEDLDTSMLTIIDLKQHNSELQDQIHALQQHISDLEEQVSVVNQHNATLIAIHQQTHERIVYLEGQVQRFVTDRSNSTSTPVRNITTHSTPLSTPLRYQSATPSHSEPTRIQTPSGYGNHAAPQTPDASSRRQFHSSSGTPTVSRTLHLGTPFASCPVQESHSASPPTSRTAHASASLDASNSDGSPPPCVPLLPYYINLYQIHHLSASLDLISLYTPAKNRLQELLKLGLDKDVCHGLIEAMTLD